MSNEIPMYSYTAGVSYETEPMDMIKIKFVDERAKISVSTFCKTFDHRYKPNETSKLLLDIIDYMPDSTYQMYGDSAFLVMDNFDTLIY